MALMFDGPLQTGQPGHNIARPAPHRLAEFIEQIVPAAMLAGQRYEVRVAFRNVSQDEWSGAGNLVLGLLKSAEWPALEDKETWGVNLLAYHAPEPIAPGEVVNFAFAVTAPPTAGERVFRTMLFHDDNWISEGAPPARVSVEVNGAAFVSQIVPDTMVCGETYAVAIMMRNTGTTVWHPGDFHRLGHCGEPRTLGHENRWTAARATLAASASVRPGEIATFRFSVQAPADAGRYNFQWRMLQEEIEWFGEASPNVAVTCTPAPEWPKRIDLIVATVERLLEARVEAAVARRMPASATLEDLSPERTRVRTAQSEIPPETAREIDAIFSAWNADDSPGCSIGYFQHGEAKYLRGFGSGNVEHCIPLTPSSVFPAGSLAKQFVALSMLLLARDGALHLDDPLRLHVPEFPPFGDAITLRHLIHHTSGLQHDGLLHLRNSRRVDAAADPDSIEVVIQQELKPVRPGEHFLYSQSGYTLLELVLQRRAGMSLSRFAHEQIFAPLGMSSTRFCGNPRAVIAERVTAYCAGRTGKFDLANIDVSDAASSLFTTVADMARWDRNFFTATVGGDLLEEMHQRGRLSNGCRVGYAYGLVTGHKGAKTFEHTGTAHGCRSCYLRFVQSGVSMAFFTNIAELSPLPLVHKVAKVVHRWRRKAKLD